METLYSLSDAVELRIFPMGRKTLYNLVQNGEKHKLGDLQEDYVIAENCGVPNKTCWRVSEDELMAWFYRRQKMLGKKGLQKPKKNGAMI